MDAYTNIEFTPELLRNVMDFPAGQPPPGVTANFDHQASNALMLWITCGICMPIMLLAAIGKFWVRFTLVTKRFTWGDVVFVLALLGTFSWIILSFIAVEGKFFGRHMWEIKLKFIDKRTILLSITSESFWPIWFLLIKISLFAMYLEIFGVKRWMRWGCYIGMVLLTGFHVAAALFYAISCSPIGGHDNMAYLMGFLSKRCLNIFPIIIMQAAVNIVGDVYLLILPLPAVWSLHMPMRKKLGVCAMFLTGFTGIAASACSLYYRVELHSATDLTWKCIVPWVTSVYEMTAGIVVCCMPSLTALARRMTASSSRAFHSDRDGSQTLSKRRRIEKPFRSISDLFRGSGWYLTPRRTRTDRSEALTSKTFVDEHEQLTGDFNKSFDSHYTRHYSSSSTRQPIPAVAATAAAALSSSEEDMITSPPMTLYHPPTTTIPTPTPTTTPASRRWEPLPQLHFQRRSHVSSFARSLINGFGGGGGAVEQRGEQQEGGVSTTNTNPITPRVGRAGEPMAVHESHIANVAIPKTDFIIHVYDEENRF